MSSSAIATTAFVNSVIDVMIDEAERSQGEISRICIASLLAMLSLWVIGAKAFAAFSVNCGRLARLYCDRQLNEDIVTVVRFVPTIPGHIRRAATSDELAFIGVFVQSVIVLSTIAVDAAVSLWALFFGSNDIAIV